MNDNITTTGEHTPSKKKKNSSWSDERTVAYMVAMNTFDPVGAVYGYRTKLWENVRQAVNRVQPEKGKLSMRSIHRMYEKLFKKYEDTHAIANGHELDQLIRNYKTKLEIEKRRKEKKKEGKEEPQVPLELLLEYMNSEATRHALTFDSSGKKRRRAMSEEPVDRELGKRVSVNRDIPIYESTGRECSAVLSQSQEYVIKSNRQILAEMKDVQDKLTHLADEVKDFTKKQHALEQHALAQASVLMQILATITVNASKRPNKE